MSSFFRSSLRIVLITVLLIVILDLADSRRGGGARFSSRFRSRYGSTRIRQRYGTSVRIRHGHSRFGGSTFQTAMTTGLIFGLMSNYQRRRYYRRNTNPYVCQGRPSSKPLNSTRVQYFICPEENMPDNLRFCCGVSHKEYCCDESSKHSSGSKAGMMIGIIGAIACGLCIISTIVFVCKRKAAQPGAIILKPNHSKGDKSNSGVAVTYNTTENHATVPTYPNSAPVNYQAQQPMDPKDAPAYPAAQYPPMPQAQPAGMPPPAPYPSAPNQEAPPYPGAQMPTMPPYPVANQPPPYSQ